MQHAIDQALDNRFLPRVILPLLPAKHLVPRSKSGREVLRLIGCTAERREIGVCAYDDGSPICIGNVAVACYPRGAAHHDCRAPAMADVVTRRAGDRTRWLEPQTERLPAGHDVVDSCAAACGLDWLP